MDTRGPRFDGPRRPPFPPEEGRSPRGSYSFLPLLSLSLSSSSYSRLLLFRPLCSPSLTISRPLSSFLFARPRDPHTPLLLQWPLVPLSARSRQAHLLSCFLLLLLLIHHHHNHHQQQQPSPPSGIAGAHRFTTTRRRSTPSPPPFLFFRFNDLSK